MLKKSYSRMTKVEMLNQFLGRDFQESKEREEEVEIEIMILMVNKKK